MRRYPGYHSVLILISFLDFYTSPSLQEDFQKISKPRIPICDSKHKILLGFQNEAI